MSNTLTIQQSFLKLLQCNCNVVYGIKNAKDSDRCYTDEKGFPVIILSFQLNKIKLNHWIFICINLYFGDVFMFMTVYESLLLLLLSHFSRV